MITISQYLNDQHQNQQSMQSTEIYYR
ncbi:MAG: hypothetical protein ACI8RD_010375, partial [Bacillariaceae sp.]